MLKKQFMDIKIFIISIYEIWVFTMPEISTYWTATEFTKLLLNYS